MTVELSSSLLESLQNLIEENATSGDIQHLQHALAAGDIMLGARSLESIKSSAVLTAGEDIYHLSAAQVDLLLNTPYTPHTLTEPETPVEPGRIPPGSRLHLLRNECFTGREEDLHAIVETLIYDPEIKRHLAEDEVERYRPPAIPPGIFIIAPDGSGKSQLALEFCYRYAHRFQAVFWLQADHDITMELAACGPEMKIAPFPKTITGQVQAVLHTLERRQPYLIVLDGLKNAAMLQEWLSRLPTARFLITTQQAARLPKIPDWKAHPLSRLTKTESRSLIFKLAPRLEVEDKAELDTLLSELDGAPQALDLAGRTLNRFPDLSPQDYLQEMDAAAIGLTQANTRGHQQRIPALAMAFTVSWERLWASDPDSVEQRLLQICGHCAPNTPIPWEILAETLQSHAAADGRRLYAHLGQLYDSGLLIRTALGPLIHPLAADFARWIENAVGVSGALETLVDALQRLSRRALQDEQFQLASQLRPHLQTTAWSAEAAGLQHAGTLWNSLGEDLLRMTEYTGAQMYLERALSAAEPALGSNHPDIARIVNNLGRVLEAQKELQSAHICYQQALRIYENAPGNHQIQTADVISNLGSVLHHMGEMDASRAQYEKALRIFGQEHGARRAQVSDILTQLGKVLYDQQNFPEAQACFERALEVREAIQEGPHPEHAANAYLLAQSQEARGKLNAARDSYHAAMNEAESLYGIESEKTAQSLHALMRMLGAHTGLSNSALNAENPQTPYHQALAIDRAIFGPQHPNTAARYHALAQAQLASKKLENVYTNLNQAHRIWEIAYGSQHPEVAAVLNDMGRLCFLQARFADARKVYSQALRIYQENYGPEHPAVAGVIANIGELLWAQQDLTGAQTFLLRALLLNEIAFGKDHPNVAGVLNNLGSVLWANEDLDGAAACFRRALRIDEAAYDEQHPGIARDANNLGDVLYRQGDLDGAQEMFERAMRIQESLHGPAHPEVAAVINNLGGVLWARGSKKAARALYLHALEIDEAALGPQHLDVARDASNLGRVLQALGEPRQARVLFQRALNIRSQHLPPGHPKIETLRRSLEELPS